MARSDKDNEEITYRRKVAFYKQGWHKAQKIFRRNKGRPLPSSMG